MMDRGTEYTVKHEERKMLQDALITENKKNKFINEIQNGLGELIKEEPNKIPKKVRWYNKLFKIFTND
jgi:hypothetical protein